MIEFDMADFEAAVRTRATQSLKYGQGAHVAYDFDGIENWVYDNVVGNIPVVDPTMMLFGWAGEDDTEKAFVGGIKQVRSVCLPPTQIQLVYRAPTSDSHF